MNLVRILIAVCISLFFALLIIVKVKAALALSFIFLFTPLYWILCKKIDEKIFVRVFFVIYPLLPFLAGVNLGAGIPVLRAHRVAVMLLLLFLMSKGLFWKCYSEFFAAKIFHFSIILIIISMFITSLFSSNMKGTLFFSLSYIFEFFIFTAVIFSIFKTKKDIDDLIESFVISGIILCCLGIFEKITGFNFYSKLGAFHSELNELLEHQIRGGGIRVKANFEHSISYSAYLVMMLPLMFYRFKSSFKYFNISLVLILTALMASQSRAGFLGAGIIFILYMVFIERKNMMLLMVLSIPVLLYFSSDILEFLINLNPFTTTSKEMSDSTAARGQQLVIMSAYIKQNIFFGYGLVPANIISIDNFYLSYAYQFGLAGLIAYLFLIISIFVKPFVEFGRTIRRSQLMMLLLFSIFAFAVINSLVTLLSYHFILYVYMGIMARLIYNNRKGNYA